MGCVTVDYTGETLLESSYVEIFWQEPDFEYEVLGRIQATGELTSESEIFDKILDKAKQVGAKGIIVQNTSKDVTYVSTGDGLLPVETTYIWALAIWY